MSGYALAVPFISHLDKLINSVNYIVNVDFCWFYFFHIIDDDPVDVQFLCRAINI